MDIIVVLLCSLLNLLMGEKECVIFTEYYNWLCTVPLWVTTSNHHKLLSTLLEIKINDITYCSFAILDEGYIPGGMMWQPEMSEWWVSSFWGCRHNAFLQTFLNSRALCVHIKQFLHKRVKFK